MNCICEKHKEELKNLTNDELKKRLLEESLKILEMIQSTENQKKICESLIKELKSRK